MNFFALDPGSQADWVAALAAALGCLLSISALVIALRANHTADRTRSEARDAASAQHDREAARDRRQLAGSVAAWWVASRDKQERRYGVVVSNQSPTSAVFYDVEVHVRAPGGSGHVIRMKVLPPGKFFVQHKLNTPQSPWEGIPLPVLASDVFDPFTVATDRSVTRLEYADGLGTRWRWSATDGLTELTRGRAIGEPAGNGAPS